MNDEPLKSLFEAARQAAGPAPPEQFPQRVLRTLRRPPEPPSLGEQLVALFPRFAVGAALVLALGLGVDRWLAGADSPGWAGDAAALTEQWLFAATPE